MGFIMGITRILHSLDDIKMNIEEINRITNAINQAFKEEDIDFKAEFILDQDIENLIMGEG